MRIRLNSLMSYVWLYQCFDRMTLRPYRQQLRRRLQTIERQKRRREEQLTEARKMRDLAMTQWKVGEKCGYSERTVRNRMRLLEKEERAAKKGDLP